MPPNNITAVHCVEQEIKVKPKGLKIILMGDLNVRPRDPRDEREEDLMMTFVDRGLVSMTDNFMPRQQYRGSGSWECNIQREVYQVRGDQYEVR